MGTDELEVSMARIREMEGLFERVSNIVRQLGGLLEEYRDLQDNIARLDAYYGSSQWKTDCGFDERGLLPSNLNRGVLSEDGLWNMLEDNRLLKEYIRQICTM